MSYTLGEVLYWEERCRIRHLPTRLYLTVQKGENGGGPKWTVGCPTCSVPPLSLQPNPMLLLLSCCIASCGTLEYNNNRTSVGLG